MVEQLRKELNDLLFQHRTASENQKTSRKEMIEAEELQFRTE